MAGAQKNFELLFKLSASLGGNFNSTFNNAITAQKRLSDSIKTVNTLQSKVDGYNKAAAAIEQNRGKLQRLTAEHDRLQSELNETAQRKKELQKAMQTAEAEGNIQEYKRLESELAATQREYSKLNEKYKANQNQIQQTTAKIEEQEKALDELGQELRDAGVNTEDLGRENDRLRESYERLQAQQKKLQDLAQKQEKVKAAISETKTEIVKTVGAYTAVAAAIYAGPVKAAQEYETALAKVNTIADTQAVPLEDISKQVLALSNTTGVAASALAEDVYNAISAGQKTGDAVNFVSYSTKLAKAGFAETSQTLDVLTTILNAYGMEADKVGVVSDMLIQIQNKGKVSVGELSSTMGKIIPTANAYNVSLEQLGATYAIMTSKGINAAQTTTYANSMLNELGKSGTKADKILRQVSGSGFADLMASGMSLGEVLAILQTEAEKSGKTIADMFGSAEAGKAAMSLLADGVDGFNASVADMVGSVGATETAFGIMADTTENKMDKAKNSIKNLQISLGQNLLPIVGNVADKMATLINKITEFAQNNPQAVKTILKVVGGLAALKLGGQVAKLGFLEVKNGVLNLMGAWEKLKSLGGIKGLFSGLGGIKGKILPIIGIIGAVAAAIGLISGNLEKVRGWIQQTFGDTALAIFDKVWGVIQSIGDSIGGLFSGSGMEGGMFDSLTGAIEQVKAILPGLLQQFAQMGKDLLPVVMNVIKRIAPLLAQIVAALLPALANIVATILPMIAEIVATVLPVLVELISQLLPIIGEIIAAILPVLLELISQIVPFITQIIEAILPVMIQLIETLLPIIMQIIEAVLPVLQSLLQALMPVIQQIVEGILPMVINLITTVVNAIMPLVEMILPLLQQLLTAIMPIIQAVAEMFGNVLGAAIEAISGVLKGLTTILGGLIDFITGVFTGNWEQAWEGVKSIFSGIWEAIVSVCKGVINGIISAINVVISGLNCLKIPDWVPGIGGVGINIPLIPMLAKGSKFTPDTFIAGENGPELITNAPGRTVYTAEQTRQILEQGNRAASAVQTAQGNRAAYAAQEAPGNPERMTRTLEQGNRAASSVREAQAADGNQGMQSPAEVKEAPEVVKVPGGGTTQNINIQNSPTIVVQGDNPGDLEEKLEQNNQKLIREFQEITRQQAEDERRIDYE